MAHATEEWLARVEAATLDSEVELTTQLGGQRELAHARLWRGQVLIDWEVDDQAGGCLVRPELLRRLVALGAQVQTMRDSVQLRASGRALAALSAQHADLVRRLGGAERVEMRATLRFAGEQYRGGEELYAVGGGPRAQPLLRLMATVRSASPRTSPAKR